MRLAPMRVLSRRTALFAGLTVWAAAVALGLSNLWSFEQASGAPARAPDVWPVHAQVERSSDTPTLVVLIHPHCPCSRATIGELARIMTVCQGRLSTVVLMLRPDDAPAGWERTGLWDTAAEIPGVVVMSDEAGRESQRFGGFTSGQSLLYSAEGKLLFAGGITVSRGHSGDNDGRSAVVARVLGNDGDAGRAAPASTPVFGCPLQTPKPDRSIEGSALCLK